MTKPRRHADAKWDESDFTMQVEEYEPTDKPDYIVDRGRIFKAKPTIRKIGPLLSTRVCIHGRLESDAFRKPVPCATCEYEVPRFLAARDDQRPGVA
jgi:hypothetical protein